MPLKKFGGDNTLSWRDCRTSGEIPTFQDCSIGEYSYAGKDANSVFFANDGFLYAILAKYDYTVSPFKYYTGLIKYNISTNSQTSLLTLYVTSNYSGVLNDPQASIYGHIDDNTLLLSNKDHEDYVGVKMRKYTISTNTYTYYDSLLSSEFSNSKHSSCVRCSYIAYDNPNLYIFFLYSYRYISTTKTYYNTFGYNLFAKLNMSSVTATTLGYVPLNGTTAKTNFLTNDSKFTDYRYGTTIIDKNNSNYIYLMGRVHGEFFKCDLSTNTFTLLKDYRSEKKKCSFMVQNGEYIILGLTTYSSQSSSLSFSTYFSSEAYNTNTNEFEDYSILNLDNLNLDNYASGWTQKYEFGFIQPNYSQDKTSILLGDYPQLKIDLESIKTFKVPPFVSNAGESLNNPVPYQYQLEEESFEVNNNITHPANTLISYPTSDILAIKANTETKQINGKIILSSNDIVL